MTYKATVQDGQVVVRNIELPDGTPVEVSVRAQTFDEAVAQAVREGEADFRRGDYGVGEELVDIARYGHVRRSTLQKSAKLRARDRRAVARKSGSRVKRVR